MPDKKLCETCRRAVEIDDASKCNNCWEVERRLGMYLRAGGAKARQAIVQALLQEEADPRTPPRARLTLESEGRAEDYHLFQLEWHETAEVDRVPDGPHRTRPVHTGVGTVLVAGRYRFRSGDRDPRDTGQGAKS